MASALVIGIGSTGFEVIERALQYHYEFTKRDRPDHTAFMVLETARKTSEYTKKGILSFCDISTDNIKATLNAWHQEAMEDTKWVPTEAEVLNAHNGAGGQPVYGRLGLWANENNVRAKIKQLYNDIQGNPNTNIYIVGSLVGGTGSGICLDTAYMVRETTGNENIFGMFLLPNRVEIGDKARMMGYENAYTSLKSIDYYSKSDPNGRWYKCKMPSGTSIDYDGSPYRQTQFFTQDFADASAQLPRLKELVQSVGFNLVLKLLDITNVEAPFHRIIWDRVVDFSQAVSDGIFSTIGMNVFQYPEGLLEEYFATEQLKRSILDRWSDAKNYISKVGSSASIEALTLGELKPRVNNKIQEIIKSAIESSRGTSILGHKTMRMALEAEVSAIIEKSYPSETLDRDSYIYDLFDAKNTSRYYAAIKGKSLDLRNNIVEAIANYVDELSDEYQNLTILKNVIQFIGESFEDVIKGWKYRYNLDGTVDGWNKYWNDKLLQERFHNLVSFFSTITLSKSAHYYEALDGVAQLCYFNVLFEVIEQITNSLNSKSGINPIKTPNSVLLPTIDIVNLMFEKVKKLLDEKEENSIMYRHDIIKGQLEGSQNSQINFLYKSNSFAEDVAQAQGKYDNDGKILSFKDISTESMWKYLKDNEFENLGSDMIKKSLTFVQELKLFNDSDIVEIMKKLPVNDSKYPKVHSLLTDNDEDIVKTLPAMCQLIKTEKFVSHDKLKLIVISDSDENSGIVSVMKGYKPSQNGSNYVKLPSMKNTVVVYQEYCYLGTVGGVSKVFNPLTHICYQSQVLEAIKQKGNNFNSNKLRLAYLNDNQIIDESNIKIK